MFDSLGNRNLIKLRRVDLAPGPDSFVVVRTSLRPNGRRVGFGPVRRAVPVPPGFAPAHHDNPGTDDGFRTGFSFCSVFGSGPTTRDYKSTDFLFGGRVTITRILYITHRLSFRQGEKYVKILVPPPPPSRVLLPPSRVRVCVCAVCV